MIRSKAELGAGSARTATAIWIGLGALGAWTRWPEPWWLLVAAGASILATVGARHRGWVAAATASGLLVATTLGFFGQADLHRLQSDWEGYREAELREAGGVLESTLDDLIVRGDTAISELARLAPELVSRGGGADRRLAAFLRAGGFQAVAIYDAEGQPVVWQGLHQGVIPEEVRRGIRPYVYGESPLYGYLYFTRPIQETGGTAAGAVLLREELPAPLAPRVPRDFASSFGERYGEAIRFIGAQRSDPQAIWDLSWEGRPLLGVVVDPPTQAARRATVRLTWSQRVLVAAVLSWLLLLVSVDPRRRGGALALSVLTGSLLLPLGPLFGLDALFSAADFRLPGPLPATLGRTLAVAVAASVAFGASRARAPARGPWVAAVAVAFSFPLLLLWLSSAASDSLLAGSETIWAAYAGTLSLVLAVVAAAALALGRSDGQTNPWALAAGILLALGLAAASAYVVRTTAGPSLGLLVAWGVPAFLIASGLGQRSHWASAPLAMAMAALLATTAATPHAWATRTQGRMVAAEHQLARLGSPVDPYLEFLLERLGTEMQRVREATTRPIELLYESWAASGLADEGYPMWLTLWTDDRVEPREELPIGVAERRPAIVEDFLEVARGESEIRVRRFDLSDTHYLATIPLTGGWVATVVVPPRRRVLSTSPLGPLFSSVERSTTSPLILVPLAPSQAARIPSRVTWERSPRGFDGETLVDYPDAVHRAHYLVDLPGSLLLIARGTLLILSGMGLFLFISFLGRIAVPEARPEAGVWKGIFTAFRTRITLALFAFFLLSTAGIGVVAWRALSGASIRTATALADRIVHEAADGFQDFDGELGSLARRVGADLVVYRNGQLDRGAVHELVELGIYPGLLPPEVHRALDSGDALSSSSPGELGRWEYAMAYRRLRRGLTMATPVGVETAALALRRREALDLLGFAVVLGALLSFGLALLVGRTLAQPIHTLQVASERVGGGDLSHQLPATRTDEFGSVFLAFNRMVQRLSSTREALIRTTRRTEAIVEEAATGVLAVDPLGAVVLVNPRAETLLGVDVPVGAPLPRVGQGVAAEFAEWTERFFQDSSLEGSMEFQLGERRIRARGRRVSKSEPFGGGVFSIEDVTDELHTERVLAWGEMAQQVAHEVKNPLTPIKLSVQHVQRAWEDGATDFGEVLDRNFEVVLREIDRLADIAGSFSRLSAPSEAAAVPLEPVVLEGSIAEVLALYRAGVSAKRFVSEVEADLPPVQARDGELKEVLVNLVENAREAVSERGTVRIEAALNGEGVEVHVRDDGRGIPQEELPRIFQPHFSTRSAGTGLGLAIVKRLVESWGGTVSARSEEGVGTLVTVSLKVWPDVPAEAVPDDRTLGGDPDPNEIQ